MNISTLVAREKSDYVPIPEGQHRAVCSAIVSLGNQESFGSVRHQMVMGLEFPDVRIERDEDGQKIDEPRMKWTFYTVSLHNKANLRKDLESWRGRGFTKEELEGFDVMSVLGHACLVTIIHDHSGEKVKDKITSFGKIHGDGEIPKPELPLISYTEENNEHWDLLPEWIREKIRSQIVVEAPIVQETESEDPDDADIPF